MKKSNLYTLLFLGLAQVGYATPTTMTAVLDPFTQVQAELDVPVEENCTSTNGGRSVHVTTCVTPGATLVLTKGSESQTIEINEKKIIASSYAGNLYEETLLTGSIMIAGKPVEAKIRLFTKNGLPFPGSLSIHRQHTYTLVY